MKTRGPDLVGVINFSAGNTSVLQVPYPSYIQTGLLLRLVVPKTEGGGPAPYQDHLARLITAMSYGKGGVRYLAVGAPDIRVFLHALEQRAKNGWRQAAYTAGAVTEEMLIPIHFGLNPTKYDGTLNDEDATVGVLPDNGLVFSVSWAQNSAIGANITVGAAYLEVYQYGIIAETSSETPAFRPAFFQTAPTMKQASGLGMSENLAIGSVYRATTFMFVNGASPNDLRTDGESANAVSQLALSFNLPGKGNDQVLDIPVALFTRLSQLGAQVAMDNAAVPGATLSPSTPTVSAIHNPGIGRIDWYHRMPRQVKATQPNAAYGVDLTNAQTNAVQLNYTVDAVNNTAIYEFHEAYVKQGVNLQAGS